MFGQVASIVQSITRKSCAFQEKLDTANTTMRNLKLTENMQTKVRDFMLKTISNMDSQKELEAFLKILSPSVKKSVTNHIFTEVIL